MKKTSKMTARRAHGWKSSDAVYVDVFCGGRKKTIAVAGIEILANPGLTVCQIAKAKAKELPW